ncbi:MAG: prepilin-type N-terminal cleavage/methylation domain-containing protein [Planctomycetaceae bacterium]|jgi:hypothetical protein|nr:prepilin-type N-terminal cleavage/methylation domain-containing protein [Planctomycetaceae bacterium]
MPNVKMGKTGGGAGYRGKLRTEGGKSWFYNGFSTKFLSHSFRFGFTLVELLVVIAIIRGKLSAYFDLFCPSLGQIFSYLGQTAKYDFVAPKKTPNAPKPPLRYCTLKTFLLKNDFS